jgi:hypothetical protein
MSVPAEICNLVSSTTYHLKKYCNAFIRGRNMCVRILRIIYCKAQRTSDSFRLCYKQGQFDINLERATSTGRPVSSYPNAT